MIDIGTCVAQMEPWVPEHLDFRFGLALDTSPVRIGEKVMALGYPQMEFDGDPYADNAFSGQFHFPQGTVTEVFPSAGPTGQKAPCFSIDARLPHGMSGGPVVTEDGAGNVFVRGIVRSDFSGSDPLEPLGSALVTSIWPLLILPFRPPTETGEIDWTQSLLEMERRGTLIDKAKGHQRIEIRRDGEGKLMFAKYRDGNGMVVSEVVQPVDVL